MGVRLGISNKFDSWSRVCRRAIYGGLGFAILTALYWFGSLSEMQQKYIVATAIPAITGIFFFVLLAINDLGSYSIIVVGLVMFLSLYILYKLCQQVLRDIRHAQKRKKRLQIIPPLPVKGATGMVLKADDPLPDYNHLDDITLKIPSEMLEDDPELHKEIERWIGYYDDLDKYQRQRYDNCVEIEHNKIKKAIK